jgi:phage-related minor tail protein
MDQVVDNLVVQVRANTTSFAGDVADMQSQLDGPFSKSIDAAGNKLETALAKAVVSGNLNFKSLEAAGLSALNSIATAAVKLGLDSLLGGGSGSSSSNSGGAGGDLLSSAFSAISGLFGASGRAIGGPVSPGTPYMVGENGPELFVPTSAGSIAANAPAQAPARSANVSININAPAAATPMLLAASSRQVARAVRGQLLQEW